MKETGEPRTWHLSVVLTATREGTELFDSLDEMPAVLRARCVQALDSKQSQTVIIADAAGREYLQHLIEEKESTHPAEPPPPQQPPAKRRYSLRLAAEIAICGAIGLTLWLLATLR